MPKKEVEVILRVTGVKYLGKGERYMIGIPARGLTLEEWEKIPEDLRRRAVDAGLYEVKIIKDGEE